jgi:hypothetical protein
MYVGDDGLFCRQGPGNKNGAAVSLQKHMLKTNFSIVLLQNSRQGSLFFSEHKMRLESETSWYWTHYNCVCYFCRYQARVDIKNNNNILFITSQR